MNTLYTFGHSGRQVPELVAAAADLGAMVIDVRLSPVSQDPRWRGPNLARALGDSYQRAGTWLGNRNYDNGGPIQLADEEKGLEFLAGELEEQPIILLGVCRDLAGCHRSYIADRMAGRFGAKVEHLTAKGGLPTTLLDTMKSHSSRKRIGSSLARRPADGSGA